MTTLTDRFIQQLPEYKCSLYIEHNDYKCMYDSIDDAIELAIGWVSEEDKEIARELETIWSVYIYPDTPVGFCVATSYSLENCLEHLRNDSKD